jgi:hypothetical protein
VKRDSFFVCAILAFVAVLVVSSYLYVGQAPIIEERLQNLTDFQLQQLEFFRQQMNLLITIATLIIGGVGALIFHFYRTSATIAQQRWALVSCLLAGLSLYFGYVTYDATLWMLEGPFFNLSNIVIRVPSILQVATSAVSILCFVICFLITPAKRLRRKA